MNKILPVCFGEQILAMSAISKIASLSDPEMAQELLEKIEAQALLNLCGDIRMAREYMEKVEPFEPFGCQDSIRCCQLALHGSHVLDDDAESLIIGIPKYREKLISFFQIWDERFDGWRNQDTWCFETEPRIKAILYFLLNWHTMDLQIAGDTSRGCAFWLKQKGYIPENAETRFDNNLKKTIVVK